MRRLGYILIAVLLSFSLAPAQTFKQLLAAAEDQYEAGRFTEAADLYKRLQELRPNDENIAIQYIGSLQNALQYDNAIEEAETLIQSGLKSEGLLYQYGNLLKIQESYSKADSVFDALLAQMTGNSPYFELTRIQKEGTDLALRQRKLRRAFDVAPLDEVNSKFNDFAASANWATGDVLLSTQRSTGQKTNFDPRYGGNAPNIIAYAGGQGGRSRTRAYEGFNSRNYEANGVFSRDGRTYYFTSCKTECEILLTRWDGSKWSRARPLNEPINLKDTNSKQPALSATGDTLFFSSDRIGGQGGYDIWMTMRIDSTTWSPAINMGERINTAGDEATPAYSSAFRALSFSSNYHAGYGGYDIFLAKGVSFYAPEIYNIGPPFNSSKDDNYFSLGNKEGFLSSNRSGDFDIFRYTYDDEIRFLRSLMGEEALVNLSAFRSASLDIQTLRLEDFKDFHMFRPIEEKKEVTVRRINSHKQIIGRALPDMRATLNISDQATITTLTDDNGRFVFPLLPDSIGENFTVYVGSQEIPAKAVDTTYRYYKYAFENIYFNSGSTAIRQEADETLKDLMAQFDPENIVLVDINTHADNVGSREFNFDLSARRGLSVIRRLEVLGLPRGQTRVFAYGEDKPVTDDQTWYGLLYNRRAELIVYTRRPVTFFTPDVFVTRDGVSVKNAAKSLNITESQLRTWNGLDGRSIARGTVLRVFDPEHLTPNIQYFIPEGDLNRKFTTYRLKRGETVRDLAEKFGTAEELLLEMNHLDDHPRPGTEIIIMN